MILAKAFLSGPVTPVHYLISSMWPVHDKLDTLGLVNKTPIDKDLALVSDRRTFYELPVGCKYSSGATLIITHRSTYAGSIFTPHADCLCSSNN